MPKAATTHMQHCIALARKGQYTASPNPIVGCVIVKNDKLIAEGWHQAPGQAHAEINALQQAGNDAKDATLYVSLEPCAHWGRTGPCCDAVIAAGVSKVVFGMLDPNPLVSGQGIAKIKAAGIEVQGPLMAEECAELNRGFIKRITQGLPYVRCKMAISLDGRTAMASGESKWITGELARGDVQHLRAASDAIVTGVGTILADDPSLNVRMESVVETQPLRVIVDSSLQVSPQSKCLQLDGNILLATAIPELELETELESKALAYPDQVEIKSFAGANAQVDLLALLKYLAQEKGCNDILLESGAKLAGAMLNAELVDELITYLAPKLLGSDARPLFELPGISEMSEQLALEFIEVEMLGKDCKMRSRVVKRSN